jgi:anti-sigma B factor antagonist
LDIASAETLGGEIRIAEADGASGIVVDLAALRFIDSTGLVVLFNADRRALRDGRDLAMRRGSGHVERVLELTGLDQILPFVD